MTDAAANPPPMPMPRGSDTITIMPALRGVLLGRIGAWIVDVVILVVITWFLVITVFFLGIATFGAGFVLMPVTGLLAALGYTAITIGGRKQATLGMRMAGIKVVRSDLGRPDALTAAVHALLFWVAAGTVALMLVDIAVGLVRSDRRLGHDLLTGLAVVRA
jgi:uncharacterized RDD family membrane protein YckC